jgi:hypothetical protein
MCVFVRDDALLWHHAHVDLMRTFLLVPHARSYDMHVSSSSYDLMRTFMLVPHARSHT